MLKIFRKSSWIPYEDRMVYPSGEIAHKAIAAYCEKEGFSYSFPHEDSVIINGKTHDILRKFDYGTRGYGIRLREK